jgi:multidrug transporter EmrE-like cation transporter
MLLGIGLSLLSALVINAGNLFEKRAVDNLPGISARRSGHLVRTLLTSRLWLLGALASVGGLAMQVEAYSRAPISVVQSIFSAGLVLLIIGSRVYFHEPFRRIEMVGMAVVVLAILLVSVSLTGSGNGVGLHSSVKWVLIASAATVVVVALIQVGSRRLRGGYAIVTGLSSGLLYGASSLGTKGASTIVAKDGLIAAIPPVMASPYPYVFIVLCGLGMLVFQVGLQRGRVGVIAPLNNVIASAYLVAVGTFVFREPFPSDPIFLALRLIGFAGILAGTILLAGGKSDTAGFAAVQAMEPDLGLGPVLEGELESLATHADASRPTDPAGHGD